MNCNQNFKISQVTEGTLVLGIDVGSNTHYARAFDWSGLELSKVFKFKNSFEGFQSFVLWVNDLCCKYNKSKVIAGLEPTGHYWFSLGELLKENNITIAIVNPYHVKQSKELDDNLQTKNDSKDPKIIAKLVIDGRYSFPYIPEGIYGELRVADKLKNDITQQIISIKNKIHRWLSIYFPEYENIYSSIDSKSGFLLLKETPLPKDIVELGSEGIVERWKQTKLRAVGLDKAKKLEEAAKKSIGCKNITSSARFDRKSKRSKKSSSEDSIAPSFVSGSLKLNSADKLYGSCKIAIGSSSLCCECTKKDQIRIPLIWSASVQTHPLLISNVLETKTESIVFEINFIKDSLT